MHPEQTVSIDSMAETTLTQMSHLIVAVAILFSFYCHIYPEREC